MLAPSGGGLILYQAYGNLYAMTGRKAHLLEEKQIPSVKVLVMILSKNQGLKMMVIMLMFISLDSRKGLVRKLGLRVKCEEGNAWIKAYDLKARIMEVWIMVLNVVVDAELESRSVQIIPGLLRSRNELEEILAMVEEKRRKRKGKLSKQMNFPLNEAETTEHLKRIQKAIFVEVIDLKKELRLQVHP
ncbi:hypothetical protein Tco_0318490 [Tanacetum coccineum]